MVQAMLQRDQFEPLTREFFDRSALLVAPDLIGRLLIREPDTGESGGGMRVGRIVETEAYMQDDPAFHAWGIVDAPTGLVVPSGRGYALFAPPGMSYVYLCYGVHWLLNVVTEREGIAGCVLVRALEPLVGFDQMYEARVAATQNAELCNGPGKLTQALGIGREHHQTDLCRPPIYFAEDAVAPDLTIETSSRIGITRAIDRPWRFFVANSPFVSPGVPSDIAARRRRDRRGRGSKLRAKLGG